MSRTLIKAHPLIVNASMAADVISPITISTQTSFLSYNMTWTGTPVGTFNVEVCNDAQYNADGSYISGTGSWVPLTLSATTDATGSAGTGFIDIRGTGAGFIRLHYVRTSGSGTLNVSMSGKVS
jgi:hypothetical protein